MAGGCGGLATRQTEMLACSLTQPRKGQPSNQPAVAPPLGTSGMSPLVQDWFLCALSQSCCPRILEEQITPTPPKHLSLQEAESHAEEVQIFREEKKGQKIILKDKPLVSVYRLGFTSESSHDQSDAFETSLINKSRRLLGPRFQTSRFSSVESVVFDLFGEHESHKVLVRLLPSPRTRYPWELGQAVALW